jgi:hypothetical protein
MVMFQLKAKLQLKEMVLKLKLAQMIILVKINQWENAGA